jgi:hypothetical protein
MADTGPVALVGSADGPALSRTKGRTVFMVGSFAAGLTYATGGNPVTLPKGVQGMRLVGILLMTPVDGARRCVWNGDVDDPKLLAYSAYATPQSNGNDTSAVNHTALFIFEA